MQFSQILSLSAFLALTSALPTIKRGGSDIITVVFNGAAGAFYSLNVPLDGSVTPTNNVLSISTITSTYDIADLCTLVTVDYPPALVEGPAGTWAVGPPQTVKSISCVKGGNPAPTYITIEFDGAADASYSLSVPLNGAYTPTNNVLSISAVKSTYANIPSCTFDTVDYPPALVEGPTGTWVVGPPQTVKGVSCPA